MPRYHFDLVDHTTVEDKGGQVLSDEVAAADVADELAHRLYLSKPELCEQGYFILVSDEDGAEVHRAAIRSSILA
jgi:hypothetical protein